MCVHTETQLKIIRQSAGESLGGKKNTNYSKKKTTHTCRQMAEWNKKVSSEYEKKKPQQR